MSRKGAIKCGPSTVNCGGVARRGLTKRLRRPSLMHMLLLCCFSAAPSLCAEELSSPSSHPPLHLLPSSWAPSALLLLSLLLPQLLPARLLHLLCISPVSLSISSFSALPVCSALDYEIFSSFAAVKSCVIKNRHVKQLFYVFSD